MFKSENLYKPKVKPGNIMLIVKTKDDGEAEQIETVLKNNKAKEVIIN